ncbi:MAG: hypothetical protein V4649_16665 [Bacteroidota bacterium]
MKWDETGLPFFFAGSHFGIMEITRNTSLSIKPYPELFTILAFVIQPFLSTSNLATMRFSGPETLLGTVKFFIKNSDIALPPPGNIGIGPKQSIKGPSVVSVFTGCPEQL